MPGRSSLVVLFLLSPNALAVDPPLPALASRDTGVDNPHECDVGTETNMMQFKHRPASEAVTTLASADLAEPTVTSCVGVSGYAMLLLSSGASFRVLCHEDAVVIQKRTSASVDFYRTWDDYKNGFGDEDNFWLGNEVISLIAPSGNPVPLRVDLVDGSGESGYAIYSSFSLSGESDKYQLSVSGYTGDIGDSLEVGNGQEFTTRDVDNDAYEDNCAEKYFGGWWYNSCHHANLNGRYEGPGPVSTYATSICWRTWRGFDHSMRSSLMSLALPALPTEQPTAAPTSAPTATPTASPTAQPTADPTQTTVTAVGDPHLKNINKELFEVRVAGAHALLTVPQGAPAVKALLNVGAIMERMGSGCSSLFIRSLDVMGQWLGEVPPLRFAAGSALPGEANGAVLQVGNSSGLSIDEFLSKVPASMIKLTLPAKDIGVSRAANKHATLMTAALQLGPGVGMKVSWTSERTPSASIAHSLWVSVSGLSATHEAIGGLLGADDHHYATVPDSDCGENGGSSLLVRTDEETAAEASLE